MTIEVTVHESWFRFPAASMLMAAWDMEPWWRNYPIEKERSARRELQSWTWTYRVWNGWRLRCASCRCDLTAVRPHERRFLNDMESARKADGWDWQAVCVDASRCEERATWPWFAEWRKRTDATLGRLQAALVAS